MSRLSDNTLLSWSDHMIRGVLYLARYGWLVGLFVVMGCSGPRVKPHDLEPMHISPSARLGAPVAVAWRIKLNKDDKLGETRWVTSNGASLATLAPYDTLFDALDQWNTFESLENTLHEAGFVSKANAPCRALLVFGERRFSAEKGWLLGNRYQAQLSLIVDEGQAGSTRHLVEKNYAFDSVDGLKFKETFFLTREESKARLVRAIVIGVSNDLIAWANASGEPCRVQEAAHVTETLGENAREK